MNGKIGPAFRGMMFFSQAWKGVIRQLLLSALIVMPVSSLLEAKDLSFSETDVHFYSGPGLRLVGVLSVPSNCSENKQCPGILLSYGPGGYDQPQLMQNDSTMPAVSTRLSGSGFVTLRFTYRGVGLSEGPDARLIPMEQVEDIQNAITFLQAQKAVDTDLIGLLGFATGGANATYVAGIDDRVKAMVSINGMGDLGRWMREIRPYWAWLEFNEMLAADRINRVLVGSSRLLEQRDIIVNDPTSRAYRASMEEKYPEIANIKSLLSLESAEAMANFQPELVVKDISPRAAMWIAAEHDTLLPVDHSRIMYEKAGEPKKLIVMQGEEHHSIYNGEGLERLKNHVNDWFVSQLMKK